MPAARRAAGGLAAALCARRAAVAGGQPSPAESSQGPYGVIPEGYNPEEPPAAHGNTVMISIRLVKLHSVDATANVITLTADIWRYWYDPRLSLKGQAGGGPNETVSINPAEIWTPDVDLLEKIDSFQESCSTPRALLLGDGYAARLPSAAPGLPRYNLFWADTCVLPVKCHISMASFPFDTHTCTLTFAPWTDLSYALVPANMSTASLITQEYETMLDEHKEAVAVALPMPGGAEVRTGGIRYFMRIARYSRYYMLNLICPTLMMVVLSWFVFFTPVAKSDRLAYSVTLLLAAMAVQFITADKRPAEQYDGWIDKLMSGAYIMIILPIVETAFLFRIEARIEASMEQYSADETRTHHERLSLLANGHNRIRMVDRICRVAYPIAIVLFLLGLFGPGSPVFENRHEHKAPASISLIGLSLFTIPLMGMMFWFTVKNLYQMGPHSTRELSQELKEALNDALMDPHHTDEHRFISMGSSTKSESSDDDSYIQTPGRMG